jgi:murein DD-endopeptidase MepM/ murein hydrolase activator NlpD
MIEKTSVSSLIPVYTERQYSNHLFRNYLTKSLLFALVVLCLGLSTPSARAQANAGSEASKPEERQRRVENQPSEASQRPASNTNRAATTPSVKKTVMIYTPPADGRGAPRTALVDDIVIISRADDPEPASKPLVRQTSMIRSLGATANMPSIWPVSGIITSYYGTRGNPFGGMSSEFHKGQDIAAPMGTGVIATADGVVVIAGWQRGYGRVVYLDHGNGISTRYGHLSRIDVAEGQTIKRGDQLGLVGSSGRSTGPHLHYEVRVNGAAVNPGSYLPSIVPTTTTTNTAAPAPPAPPAIALPQK